MALKEVIKHVLNDESMEPEERDILVSWFLSDKGKEDFYEVLQEDSEQVQEDGNLNYNTLLQKIHDKIDPIPGRPEKKGIRKYLWPVASTAAVLLMLLSFGRYFFTLTDTPQEEMTAEEIAGIFPGYRQAELVFGDGTKMVLDSSIRVLKDNNGRIIKQGQQPVLDYTLAPNDMPEETFNTITVPLGGEYGVILSDGTQVWLNSGSTLKYPVTFKKDKRVVSLNGEAFFKVAKSAVPFVVSTFDIDVQVLGTSFNVSAYGNDDCVMTTLVSGSVLVSSNHAEKQLRMEPGNVLSYTKSTACMNMEKCDPDIYTSWINGEFKFRDMRLEDIMKKVNRWYNCQIRFEDPSVKELRFSGAAERDRPVEYLLELIQKVTEVNFEIENKTIVLMHK